MDDKTAPDAARWTLDPEDIKDEPRGDRRAALTAIGAAFLGALGAVVVPSEAMACRRRTGITDRDPSDGVGHGHTGLNDSDPGDEGGCGRRGGGTASRGCTDSDAGPGADGAGQGRHCGGGRPATRHPEPRDPPNAPTAPPHAPCSDSDDGVTADHVGQGRSCR